MSALDELISQELEAECSFEWVLEVVKPAKKELAQLREANQILRQAEANYDALQTPLPCGHLARYAVNEKAGTQYCVLCVAVQTESKLAIAEGALARIKAKESEFEDRVNDTPPQSVPWWNLGDIAAAALKRMEAIK